MVNPIKWPQIIQQSKQHYFKTYSISEVIRTVLQETGPQEVQHFQFVFD